MNRYPLLSARNLPAYAVVMMLWAGFTVVLALILRAATGGSVGWVSRRPERLVSAR